MTNVFIISAPSGSGKSTITRQLLARVPGLRFSISYTTRAPRGQERDGQDYFFISRSEFQARAGLSGDRMSGVLTLSAERVAQIGYDGFNRRRRLVVAGTGNQIGVRLVQLMPHAWLLPLLDWGMRQAATRS